MKKIVSLLMAILLAAAALPALAESADVSYIGFIDVTPVEAPDESLYAILPDGTGVVIIPPDGFAADQTTLYHGVQFTPDASTPAPFEHDQQIKADTLTLLPAVIGSVNESGDGYLVVNVSEDGGIVDNLPTKRLVLTGDTQINSEYAEGSFVMVVYDNDTDLNALMIVVSNG